MALLPDNLLNPIPGSNPSGENLRYAPVYDKLKEARREEEDLPQGDWEHEVKASDPILVTKLSVDALANKSKDLQIAAWLTEACLRREGLPGLIEGLNLLRGLTETFWDTMYPEIEDGDLELRAAPLDWIGTYVADLIRKQPLTRGGYDWFKYKGSRGVPLEEACADNESKMNARNEALSEGKLAPEIFDEDVQKTSKDFYKQFAQNLEGTLEALQALNELCDQKFGDAAPSYAKLRTALEELQHVVKGFLKKKLELEPDVGEGGEEAAAVAEGEAGAEAGAPARRRMVAEEPADRDDAVRRLVAVAKYLRREEPHNPASFLILRALRWGELRANSADPTALDPPPTEIRQQIKKLSLEGQWADVLEAAENAAALPCGRGWMDLQRYVVKACENLGSEYEPIANAVRTGLRSLLADFPQLPEMTLMDDTPTANAETQAWIRESVTPPPPEPTPAEALPLVNMGEPQAAPGGAPAPPDVYERATQLVREGKAEAAIEILAREVSLERSGRTRFQRMIQLSGLCMATGHERIAYPILQELADEIDRRKLEEWEPREVVAQPLALLFRCMNKLDHDEEARKKVYERLCRLDPVQALSAVK